MRKYESCSFVWDLQSSYFPIFLGFILVSVLTINPHDHQITTCNRWWNLADQCWEKVLITTKPHDFVNSGSKDLILSALKSWLPELQFSLWHKMCHPNEWHSIWWYVKFYVIWDIFLCRPATYLLHLWTIFRQIPAFQCTQNWVFWAIIDTVMGFCSNQNFLSALISQIPASATGGNLMIMRVYCWYTHQYEP